jgi:hypothetical protein
MTTIIITDPTIITDRQIEQAYSLPSADAFISYCEAREAGQSHIRAMHTALTAFNAGR